jgi:hypothetical protein
MFESVDGSQEGWNFGTVKQVLPVVPPKPLLLREKTTIPPPPPKKSTEDLRPTPPVTAPPAVPRKLHRNIQPDDSKDMADMTTILDKKGKSRSTAEDHFDDDDEIDTMATVKQMPMPKKKPVA